jgi:hypothetical protein
MWTRSTFTPKRGPRALSALTVAVCVITAGAAAQSPGQLNDMLERVAQRVQDYYERAQSIVCIETVRLQPLRGDFMPDGPGRSLEYDLRVSWDSSGEDGAPPEAQVIRELRAVNGRRPRPNAEPGCFDPKPLTPEPLAMLLPRHREEYAFRWAGLGKAKDRRAVMLDYKSLAKGPIEGTWKGDCVSISLPGHTKGRVWIDQATNEILRLDEWLTGWVDYNVPNEHWRWNGPQTWVIERADSSIHYRSVAFHDPDETILLPESIESVQFIRGGGTPGLRMTQVFSQYRRFLTSGRIVK